MTHARQPYPIRVQDHMPFQDTVRLFSHDRSACSRLTASVDLPVANRTNLFLMTNSHVSRILWARDKRGGLLAATGVEYLALEVGDPKTRTIVCYDWIQPLILVHLEVSEHHKCHP